MQEMLKGLQAHEIKLSDLWIFCQRLSGSSAVEREYYIELLELHFVDFERFEERFEELKEILKEDWE